jgi:branched-chain amino acid transport system permease protein
MNTDVLATALINGILNGGVYSLSAIGLTLIFGVMGVGNFAHGTFMMAGMYVVYWLFVVFGVDPYLGLIPAAALLFVWGWFIQRFFINRIMDAPHYNGFILTLGILLFTQNLALFLWPDYRALVVPYRDVGISIKPGIEIDLVRLLAFLFAIGLSVGLHYFLALTDLGKTIRATSQNKLGAEVVGIDVGKVYALTFAIGAACAGASGALIAPYFPLSPDVGDVFILVAFVVVCLGGMGNYLGAMIAGLIIGVAESVGSIFIPGGQKELVTFIIFIAVLLFRPQGLFNFSGYWQVQAQR